MNIRPVQKPRPPIWIAANNDPAIKRAARLGDSWFINPHAAIDTIRRQMSVYRRELKEAGKSFPDELPIVKEVYCAKDRATALKMAGPYLEGKYKDYATWGQDKVMPRERGLHAILRRIVEGAIYSRIARRMLRAAQALLGGIQCQPSPHSNELGRHATL